MSVQTALQFIHRVRKDDTLKTKIHALAGEVDLESLVQIGIEVGIVFTVEELQTAYKYDWAMRGVHYGIGASD